MLESNGVKWYLISQKSCLEDFRLQLEENSANIRKKRGNLLSPQSSLACRFKASLNEYN